MAPPTTADAASPEWGMSPALSSLRSKLGRKAKGEPKFRFYTLYGHIHRMDTLEASWKRVRASKGAPGVDGVSIAQVETREGGVEHFLEEIQESLCAIQTIFQTAIREGFFKGANPVDGIRKKIKLDVETPRKPKALKMDQLSRLIEIAQKSTRDMYLAIAIGGYSGLRKGEIANLRWEEIDFENDTVSVTRKERDDKNGIVGWVAKTKAGYRTLPLFPELKEILLPYRKESGYVIEAKSIQRSKWSLPKEFDQIRKEFDVPWFTFHVLRHTFASLLLNQGIEVHIVAKILGHETMDVTEKIYFHFIPLTRKISLKE